MNHKFKINKILVESECWKDKGEKYCQMCNMERSLNKEETNNEM